MIIKILVEEVLFLDHGQSSSNVVILCDACC